VAACAARASSTGRKDLEILASDSECFLDFRYIPYGNPTLMDVLATHAAKASGALKA
jgi:hypothetical protein